jgi:transposase
MIYFDRHKIKGGLTMSIMIGIDMHVKNLVCEIGFNKKKPVKRTYLNDEIGHELLIKDIEAMKSHHSTNEVLAAHEASGLGYILYDRLKNKGYHCAILAPTELLRSSTGYKKKTDKKDASYIYETIRGHILAGNKLHDVWVPDKELREDRDIVRTRFDITKKITGVKVQIQALCKKYGIRKPENIENWTAAFKQWLTKEQNNMGNGFKLSLESLLRQLTFLEEECKVVEKEVKKLSKKQIYKNQYDELIKINGVGLLTAMTFLTEIGDVSRFENRRQIGSYLGLVPSSFESGNQSDKKGKITNDGPYRLRSVLNQAVWVHLRYNGEEKRIYEKICERNPKHKKKAVVACMRRLGIKMWHVSVEAKNKDKIVQSA